MTVVMPALQDAVLLIMFAHACNLPCSHDIFLRVVMHALLHYSSKQNLLM